VQSDLGTVIVKRRAIVAVSQETVEYNHNRSPSQAGAGGGCSPRIKHLSAWAARHSLAGRLSRAAAAASRQIHCNPPRPTTAGIQPNLPQITLSKALEW